MATQELTETVAAASIVEATMTRLHELADAARFYRGHRAEGTEYTKRQTFIHWSESTAEARGFLDCLATLHVLSESEEAAWYEYMNGERDKAPEGDAP